MTESNSTVTQDKSWWERTYREGLWENLRNPAESIRYSVVATMIHNAVPRPVHLLDAGCGEGIILEYLGLDFVGKYTGLDIAQSALDRIKPKRAQDRCLCTTLEEYEPDDLWDVVLFNEVLYYTDDPVAQIRRFEKHLTARGVFLVSMHKKQNPFAYNNRCIRQTRRYFTQAGYQMLNAVEIKRLDASCAWQLFLVKPGR